MDYFPSVFPKGGSSQKHLPPALTLLSPQNSFPSLYWATCCFVPPRSRAGWTEGIQGWGGDRQLLKIHGDVTSSPLCHHHCFCGRCPSVTLGISVSVDLCGLLCGPCVARVSHACASLCVFPKACSHTPQLLLPLLGSERSWASWG